MVSTARHCELYSKYTDERVKFPPSTISLSTGTLRRNMAVSHLRFSSEAVKSVDVTDGGNLNFVTEYFDKAS